MDMQSGGNRRDIPSGAVLASAGSAMAVRPPAAGRHDAPQRGRPGATHAQPGAAQGGAARGWVLAGPIYDGQGVGAVRNAEIGLVNRDLVGDEAGAVAAAVAAHLPVGRCRAVLLGIAQGHARADGVKVSVAKLPSTWRGTGFCNLWA